VQAKRDTESSNFSNFWIPAFTGMTILKLFSPIATQSRRAGIQELKLMVFIILADNQSNCPIKKINPKQD